MKNKNICEIRSTSPEDTKEIAKKLCEYLQEGDVVCLCGELGCGKTTFTQGILEGFGFQGYVHSPSFIIVNKYISKIPVLHIDLYRFEDTNKIQNTGIEEYLYSDEYIIIIEWAERIKSFLPDDYFLINFKIVDENVRILECSGEGKKATQIMEFCNDINNR